MNFFYLSVRSARVFTSTIEELTRIKTEARFGCSCASRALAAFDELEAALAREQFWNFWQPMSSGGEMDKIRGFEGYISLKFMGERVGALIIMNLMEERDEGEGHDSDKLPTTTTTRVLTTATTTFLSPVQITFNLGSVSYIHLSDLRC